MLCFDSIPNTQNQIISLLSLLISVSLSHAITNLIHFFFFFSRRSPMILLRFVLFSNSPSFSSLLLSLVFTYLFLVLSAASAFFYFVLYYFFLLSLFCVFHVITFNRGAESFRFIDFGNLNLFYSYLHVIIIYN